MSSWATAAMQPASAAAGTADPADRWPHAWRLPTPYGGVWAILVRQGQPLTSTWWLLCPTGTATAWSPAIAIRRADDHRAFALELCDPRCDFPDTHDFAARLLRHLLSEATN